MLFLLFEAQLSWVSTHPFCNRNRNGNGKKVQIYQIKGKYMLSFFPQEKVELSSTFSCGHAGKRLGKRV